jgi:hypothetical protein
LVAASLCARADLVALYLVFFRNVLLLRRLFSSFLLFFSSPQVVEVVMLTDVVFLCREVVFLCRRSTLSSILLCRVDFSAFLVPFDIYFLLDFFVRRRCLVVVADVRRTLLLVDSVVATVVFVVAVVLVAEVDLVVDRPVAVVAPVVLEVVVDVVAVEAAVLDPWECIP